MARIPGPSLGRAAAAAFVAAVLLVASPAFADAIDGEWCRESSNFRIEGPQIRTPAGNQVEGNYTRHSFSYTVPVNEAGAGAEIRMQLRGEENLDLTRAIAGAAAPTER